MSPRRPPLARAQAGLWIAFLAPPLLAQEPSTPPAPPAAGQAGRVLKLTLEDALGIALRNNFDLEIEHLSTESAQYNALGSWGAFDPVLNMTTSASKSETEQQNAFSGADVVEDTDLRFATSLSVPVTTGGRFDFSYDHLNAKTNSRFATFDISTTDVLSVALTQPPGSLGG